MALPVGHRLDHRLVRPDRVEQPVGQLAVRQLDAAADVVDLAVAAPLRDQLDPAAVVVDVQPVADVDPVAVQRHPPAVEQVRHEERDDLLRELVRPVVVRAARDAHRQAVGAVVGPGQQVRRRLRRRVRRVRLQRVRLRPRPRLDRAVDLVGRHVHEPRDAALERGLQQHLGAGDVGRHEVGRAADRPVDVRLRGEVHDDVDARHRGADDRRRRGCRRARTAAAASRVTGARFVSVPA